MTTNTTTEPQINVTPEMQEMIDAGVFYGRKRNRTHPRMKRHILSNRNGIEIINLEKTEEMLKKATEAVKDVVSNGGIVLFATTQPAALDAIPMAEQFDFPVVASRWLGGTLTNFKIISGRIEHYKKLKSDFEKGAFEKYTKKERLVIERQLNDLKEFMGGLQNLTALPQLLLVIDSNIHMTAVREAKHLSIPVVAFVNSDSDPDLVTYPVLGNNKARISIQWFLKNIKEAIAQGKKAALVKAAASEVKKEE